MRSCRRLRPSERPCYSALDPTRPTRTRDHRQGCTDHQTCDEDHRWPNSAAWSGSLVPDARLRTAHASDHRYSPATSEHSNLLTARLAGPLGPATGFPGLHDGSLLPRLLRGLRPARGHQLTMSLPTCRIGDPEGRATTSGSHVHLTTVRRVRRPAPAPAASPRLRRSPSPWSPRQRNQPAAELTPHKARPRTTSRPISARFESVELLRGFNH